MAALGTLPPADREAGGEAALAALDVLPAQVSLLSMRRLVPVMRRLNVGGSLNLLTAEAAATAVILEGIVLTTTESPVLAHACCGLDIEHRVVPA